MRTFTSALVAGATGFIGFALTRRLSQEGITTFCLVREGRYDAAAFQSLPGVNLIVIPSALVPAEGLQKVLSGVTADVVFNLASYGVNPGETDPEVMIETNVCFLSRLLAAVSRWPVRKFIHTGSCFEYGEPDDRVPIREEHPLAPLSLYGAAKAASVLYGTILASRLSLPLVTLRLFGVYGLGEKPHRLLPYTISRLRRNEPVDLTPGEQVRDLLYIDDVAEAFVAAARQDGAVPFRTYNVCSGDAVSVRDVVKAVADIMNKPPHLLNWGARKYSREESPWIVGDNSKFVEATGWKPRVTLDEGIRRMTSGLPHQGRENDRTADHARSLAENR